MGRKKILKGEMETTVENNNIKAKVISIIGTVATIPENTITEDALLSRLGIDSLMALEIIALIEKHYKIEVPEEEIPKVRTLQDILNAVSAKL